MIRMKIGNWKNEDKGNTFIVGKLHVYVLASFSWSSNNWISRPVKAKQCCHIFYNAAIHFSFWGVWGMFGANQGQSWNLMLETFSVKTNKNIWFWT